ncbi:parasitic phase-specific protein PSP-1 [Apodospora peruviana]|uniref:Parasitic phase-specific protein PSP-1 n=1 Tax=Apodospora peruviana TaxID=516989 RepID=A0AAE0HUR9_9PEZI|nr:parasitic phase-specific protein PSP-1 [Apodospora peruviana]
MANTLPNGLIPFGGDANCTLALCPLESSVLQYQPSIAGNGVVIGLFALSALVHIVQGWKWKTWDFAICIVIGCLDEIVGYIGRIMLHNDPFSFGAFLMQTRIVCITTGPVFFCSAIYVQLSRTIVHLDRSLSRFTPKLLVWTFIPVDILSLVLQATGGALSSVLDNPDIGVWTSMAGLILQVVTLLIFVSLFVDYVVRYIRQASLEPRLKIFLGFLFGSIILILVRCAYRIAELREGYDGELIHEEVSFMILESLMVLLAVFCLHVGHPGIAFGVKVKGSKDEKEMGSGGDIEDSREIPMNSWNAASA